VLVGPIFTRELLTAPRRPRHFLSRAAYIAILLVILWTAWQAVVGWQKVRHVGPVAHFGAIVFQVLIYVQLSLVIFFAPLYAASAICHEKDRKTFILLLVTDLANHEIVLGKLLASLLQAGVLLVASIPLFAICLLLGGTSMHQVLMAFGVTAAATVFAGSLGSLIALWRDKTFQALALTLLWMVILIAAVEGVFGFLLPGATAWATALNPFRALALVVNPIQTTAVDLPILGDPAVACIVLMLVGAVILNVVGIMCVRRWNPSGDFGTPREEADPDATDAAGRKAETGRRVWDNPVAWREIRTRGYGRRPILIRAAYVVVFALLCVYLATALADPSTDGSALGTTALVPLTILSLFLVNAQAVTSVTSERDNKALDLLLVTDLTAKEFVFGKIVGTLVNSAVMIVLPMGMAVWLCVAGHMSPEVLVYVLVDMGILTLFVTMLGIHAAMTYDNTRTAIANSLGTVFFLFIGILLCIYLIIIGDQFGQQIVSFIIFIFAGSIGLYASLGRKNPSSAIAIVAICCPFFTFYCVTSYLLGQQLGPFLVSAAVYGFGFTAMLVPAVYEFDATLGRTTAATGRS